LEKVHKDQAIESALLKVATFKAKNYNSRFDAENFQYMEISFLILKYI